LKGWERDFKGRDFESRRLEKEAQVLNLEG
jgi:hypothetical protein